MWEGAVRVEPPKPHNLPQPSTTSWGASTVLLNHDGKGIAQERQGFLEGLRHCQGHLPYFTAQHRSASLMIR